jgi:hypothetical protein
MKSLYQALIEAGVKVSSHESDLYFPRTKESCEILQKYDVHYENARNFINQVEGGVWFDVPFAFDPYWEAKRKS